MTLLLNQLAANDESATRASEICVNHDLLRLVPGSLDAYLERGGPPCADPQYAAAVDYLTPYLSETLPAGIAHLATVSAHYAALSLRHDYEADPVACAYPLFLLAAWIWDDVVDTNKRAEGLDSLIEEGWLKIACASSSSFQTATFRSVPPPSSRSKESLLTKQVRCSSLLMGRASRLWSLWAHGFRQPIETQVIRFFHSFGEKVNLTHFAPSDRTHFINTRQICVGMQPCFEMSFAFKARLLGVSPSTLHAFTEDPLVKEAAKLATLHCAAVNDLFSMHKDRVKEDTANFPSQLAPTPDLEGYYEGARRTLRYINSTFEKFLAACAELPDHPCKQLVVETWQHMMEGNLIFHLRVPRYSEGVALVRMLLDESLSRREQRQQFRQSFPPTEGPAAAE
jgi:hypothetical protein